MVWDEKRIEELSQKIKACGDNHEFEPIVGFEEIERCPSCGLLNFPTCPPSHTECPGDADECKVEY